MKVARASILSALALATVALSGEPARAGLTNFDSFGNMQYTQTANNTQPTGTPLFFYASRLFYTNPGDVTAAVGQSGSQPQFNYTPQAGNFALFETPFITQNLLNSYLMMGTPFGFTITGGNLTGLNDSIQVRPDSLPDGCAVPDRQQL
jgi:hypothetical protein